MEWNTGKYNPYFQQSAKVTTNDPLHKSLEFTVEGQIRALLTANAPELTLPAIQPGAKGEGQVVLFSQMWDEFEVVDAYSQLPEFHWTVEDSPTSVDANATAAKRIKFSFESPVPNGSFSEKIRFEVKAPGEPAVPHHYFVSVQGQALRRFAWYG